MTTSLSKYEWIQFFFLYYLACAIDYIDMKDIQTKKKCLVFLDICSNVLSTDSFVS